MTKENNTIPGSCVPDCEGNGFYVNATDDKCYPCFDHCQICHNYSICENCYPNWFNLPDKTACVNECPSCTAYDKDLWECVYCKTRYSSPRYNLNQTCIEKEPEGCHVCNEECNTICCCSHPGCYTCDPWNSTQCTSCFPWYYKEHFKGEQPHVIGCYTRQECGKKIGGAPINRTNEGLCLNCKLENGTYRYPDPDDHHDVGKPENWTCIETQKTGTFIDIPDYNRLFWCYFRCASCDDYGITDKMNCKTCRDPSIYKIFNGYTEKPRYTQDEIMQAIGDCIKNPPPCGACSYYHYYPEDYDQEGEDICMCDKVNNVCTVCHECPENFPYYMIETRECVETCGFSELLSGVCSMSNTLAAIQFLKNPFFMKDTTTSINATQMIASLISTTFVQNYLTQTNINKNEFTNTINAVFGSGKIYNLPQSQIIIGNNVSIEFTTLKLELQKLAEIVEKGISAVTQTQSIVQMESCEQILKKQYGISDEEDLMIIKGDLIKQLSEYYASQVEYQVFSTSLGQFLDLCPCKSANATISVTNPFNISFFTGSYQAKVGSVADNGYDPFDSSSNFYNDICTPFTNENGNDVLLDDRKADYYNARVGVCESGCTYEGYNSSTKMFTCKCQIKDSITESTKTVAFDPSTVSDDFYKKHKNSNIEVIKCASQVFSSKGQSKNFGSYILLVGMASLVATFVVHMIQGTGVFSQSLKKYTSDKSQTKEDKKEASPDKAESDPGYKDGCIEKEKEKDKKIEVKNFKDLYDVEINMLEFDDAKEIKRPWYKWYWSYLQNKQIIIFTFFTQKDYQVRTIKIALFILFVSFYFAFTALFFNDSIMRQIYKYKGNAGAAIYIPSIVLSGICCLIMSLIVRFVSLSERDISTINQESVEKRSDKVSRIVSLLKIKTFILFGVTLFLTGFCWYYVSAFCAVFKNSQGNYLINVLCAFLVCNMWPFVLCLIPAFLRTKSLDSNNRCLYRASQIISYF